MTSPLRRNGEPSRNPAEHSDRKRRAETGKRTHRRLPAACRDMERGKELVSPGVDRSAVLQEHRHDVIAAVDGGNVQRTVSGRRVDVQSHRPVTAAGGLNSITHRENRSNPRTRQLRCKCEHENRLRCGGQAEQRTVPVEILKNTCARAPTCVWGCLWIMHTP